MDRTLQSVTRTRRAEAAERRFMLDMHPNRDAGWRNVAYAVATVPDVAENAYDPLGEQHVDRTMGDAPHGEPESQEVEYLYMPAHQRGVIPEEAEEDVPPPPQTEDECFNNLLAAAEN